MNRLQTKMERATQSVQFLFTNISTYLLICDGNENQVSVSLSHSFSVYSREPLIYYEEITKFLFITG